MKDLWKTAGILMAVGFVSAAVLGVTDSITRDPIARVRAEKKKQARQAIMPAAKYEMLSVTNTKAMLESAAALSTNFAELTNACLPATTIGSNVHAARDESGQLIGYVFEAVSPKGYAGDITMVVGIRVLTNAGYGEVAVSDYRVISSGETPGLGKAAEEYLHNFYTNRAVFTNISYETNRGYYTTTVITNTNIYTNVDYQGFENVDPKGVEEQVMTGATITSRAIKDALYKCLLVSRAMLRSEYERLDIDEDALKVVPYAYHVSRITNFQGQPLRALYELGDYYYRGKGYVGLGILRREGSKYMVLLGIDEDNEIAGVEVYSMKPGDPEEAFTQKEIDSAVFQGTVMSNLAALQVEEGGWTGLLKDFAGKTYKTLQKMGKIEGDE